MFNLTPYKKEHLAEMLKQPINAGIADSYNNGLAEFLEQPGSMTCFVKDKPMACGGIIPLWKGRGVVWTVFSEESKNCFVPVFRGIKKFIDEQLKEYNRIELAVPVDFLIGHKRAKLLGFKLECARAEKYLPDGTDCSLYVRVK